MIRATPADIERATIARAKALDASAIATTPETHTSAALMHDEAARYAEKIVAESNGYDRIQWQSVVAAHHAAAVVHRARCLGSPTPFAMYCALWHHAAAEGIYVGYQGIDTNVLGFFDPRETVRNGLGWPQICITRPYYYPSIDQPSDQKHPDDAAKPIDVLDELFTLAHEYGHYISFKAGNRTTEYVEAVTHIGNCVDSGNTPTISAHAIALVREEETRAWQFGRDTLQTLGCDVLAPFDERAKRSLERYEEIFRGDIQGKHVE